MESLEQTGAESMEDVFLQDDLGPTIAEHATQCQSLFNKYMSMPEIVPDPTIMDDQLARFSLWASNMDVYGPPNVSLDYRLRFSPTAADIIHQLLDIICDTLQSWIIRTAGDDASDSESEQDPAEENILNITETIGGTLTRLFRLSNAVRKSAKANRARKIDMYRDDKEANKAIEELRLYTNCYIKFRFPEAPESLRSALVEANALRLRRLYYQHSHRRRIDLSIQNLNITPAVVQIPKTTESPPTVRFAQSAVPNPGKTSKMPAPWPASAPATNATTARQTAVAALYAKSTTEVPRAKSVLVNDKLSFPPIPPTQQCPYCGVIVEFKNIGKSLLWQNHVIGDLEPFICVFSECLEAYHDGQETNPLTFETSKAWSSHMQTAHGHTWECRAPSHDPMIFHQEIHYQEHSIKEHSVPEVYAATLSNVARRPVLNKVLQCPFGDDFQPPEKAGSSSVFSNEALQAHVAGHMKEIALLALQKLPSDDDENVENIESDQPLDDDGPAGPYGITRASMCSVLDDELLDFQDDGDDSVADGNVEHREEEISAGVTILNLEDRDNLGMTRLHQAVQAGDLRLVETLIQSAMSVSSRDENGQTPLHYAMGKDFIECMRVLVKHGADLHTLDDAGFSPFLWAVIVGQENVTRRLLEDTSVLITNEDKESALTWAIRLGWTSIARMIAAHGEIVQGAYLQEAAASGSFPTVSMLLAFGHDPNHRDRDGWSAIHWAAEEGHLDIVRLLLENGAEPNAVSSYGTSPLHCAANGGHVSIIMLLLSTEVDILKPTCHGWTALHHAVYMGHSHVVRALLTDDRMRASASHQDNHGWSALHLAVLRRDLATIRILLDRSVVAEPQTLLDESGLAAEDWLYRWRRSALQKVKGNLAFSKSRCCRAITGLRRAVTTGSIPMVKLLLESGHDINGTDSGKRTALYYAVKNHMLPMIGFLIDSGADPNILPVGRVEWGEFVSLDAVRLRLMEAGYNRPEIDNESEERIRQEFKLKELWGWETPEYRGKEKTQDYGAHLRKSGPLEKAS
ncbi:ankyrin repeat domain-containing protein [Fusarium heterosporum]|uniref:Ankyrin repeat domain-containing protein n=1 Tax=Fusarium heterosporum TaxID=42747 RepID=A0A8H5T531_FUSHE|nr:ankyrin repeat domain-containing protein [Fusarium heterosporum]